jgi:N-acyl-L-homoserine lactone synthetase
MVVLAMQPELRTARTSSRMADAIEAVQQEVSIELATTPELIREAHRLRYQVYCLERGYQLEGEGLEIDEYDTRAHHVVLCHRRSGEVLGTARLVLPSAANPDHSFPVQHVCQVPLDEHLPIGSAAEVSRFALPKQREGISRASATVMRLGLVQGLVRVSHELALTHWCAVMEPSLLRLLQMTAIHFQPLGAPVDYHGIRQPCYADIDALLARMARDCPEVWAFVTGAGRWWPGTHRLAA